MRKRPEELLERLLQIKEYEKNENVKEKGSLYILYKQGGVYVNEVVWSVFQWYEEQEEEPWRVIDVVPNKRISDSEYELQIDGIKKAIEREYLEHVLESVLYGKEKIEQKKLEIESVRAYVKRLDVLEKRIETDDNKNVLEPMIVDMINQSMYGDYIRGLVWEQKAARKKLDYVYEKKYTIKLRKGDVVRRLKKEIINYKRAYGIWE
jgi:hypothetical protein